MDVYGGFLVMEMLFPGVQRLFCSIRSERGTAMVVHPMCGEFFGGILFHFFFLVHILKGWNSSFSEETRLMTLKGALSERLFCFFFKDEITMASVLVVFCKEGRHILIFFFLYPTWRLLQRQYCR